jgi:uncharacterized membrane protein YdbT with pleckstrin-like domain
MAYIDDFLADNERILLTAHRHVIFVILKTLPWALGAVFLWFLAFATYYWEPPGQGILLLILIVGSFVVLGVGAWHVVVWASEKYYVTNYRIVQVEGIFSKKTMDSSLEKVNDVVMTQSLIGRLFDYGSIKIMTASDLGVNDLAGLARPAYVKRTLMQAKLRLSDERPARWAEEDGVTADAATATVSSPPPQQSAAPGQAQPQGQPISTSTATAEDDSARAVIALTELRNSGVISEQEFNDKLRQVLRRQT